MWVGGDEAARIVKRTTRTIRSWAHNGHVRYRTTTNGREYEAGSLLQAKRDAQARYDNRPIIAGPGRARKETQ
jgi:hypothetical protein